MLKFALPLTPTPDASQWNICGVGSSGVGAGVGHVRFMLFMSISFASGTQRKPVFWWNMGFKFASPDASQWNIGGVGSSGVGHVYFMYISCIYSCIFHVVYASFSALATQKLSDAKADSSGIWA